LVGPLNNLSLVQTAQGDLNGANTSLTRALRIIEAAHGADHPLTARPLGNLGSVLHQIGDLEAAMAAFKRVLAIFEVTLPKGDPEIARALANLAEIQSDIGDPGEAEANCMRALTIFADAYPPDDPDVMKVQIYCAKFMVILVSSSASGNPARALSRCRKDLPPPACSLSADDPVAVTLCIGSAERDHPIMPAYGLGLTTWNS
jgi:tetratricopeptide (TPR) repeat protein